jgi:bifunctional UDP-N-acetylglucosamine pyrophosphorylase/glucosamine-1-phosphate N-acetyltransferase
MNELAALVLAAGMSRRMLSPLSKVLHPIAGRPLLHYPVAAAIAAGARQVVVITSPKDRDTIETYLRGAFGSISLSVVVQDPPRGTGDAARVGMAALDEGVRQVLIVCGDVPLISALELERLVAAGREGALGLGTCELADPAGYGRIVRDKGGKVTAIVEQRDLKDDAQRAIREINTGLYCAGSEPLRRALAGLSTNNAQGEYYLTDVIPVFVKAGGVSAIAMSPDATLGVNDRAQLCEVEERMFARIAHKHRVAGSRIAAGVCIDDVVVLGRDVTIGHQVHLRGRSVLGDGASVDVGCVISDAEIGAGATLLPYTIVNESRVGPACRLGPFTNVRPNSALDSDVHLGNFVELKATHMHRGAKANHLSYLGDGEVGENTNIGAGTIFCNYDGYSKHRTVIGKDVFIGSDSQLIAPVTVGDGAYVATNSSVTEDVPPHALAIGRVRQQNKPEYGARLRQRLKAEKEARAKASGPGPKQGQR